MSGVAAKAEEEVLQPPVNNSRVVKLGRGLLDLSPCEPGKMKSSCESLSSSWFTCLGV